VKQTILAMLIFRGTVAAQELPPAFDPTSMSEQERSSAVVQAALALGPSWSGLGSLAFMPQAATRQPSAPSPPPSGDGSRPRSERSMIGYIENAIVGSQLRFRTEAGFNAEFPDRAEFFYAKCGCYQSNLAGSGLPAYDPKAPGPGPGVVTRLNFQQLFFEGEYAFKGRVSLFVEVPVRWIQPTGFVPGFGSFGNQSGLGDVRAGFKAALFASSSRYLTFQLKGYFPSGDASKGLGTNHYSIEPAVLYYQALSQRLAVESEFGIWHPIGGSAGVVSASTSAPERFAGNVLFYGVGPSYELLSGERVRFAPVVEIVGWSVLGGFQTVWVSPTEIGDPASGTNIVNIKIGGRLGLGAHNSFYIGYGRALTSAVWYTDTVRFEYRYSFK
jgi:hypothetical protein